MKLIKAAAIALILWSLLSCNVQSEKIYLTEKLTLFEYHMRACGSGHTPYSLENQISASEVTKQSVEVMSSELYTIRGRGGTVEKRKGHIMI